MNAGYRVAPDACRDATGARALKGETVIVMQGTRSFLELPVADGPEGTFMKGGQLVNLLASKAGPPLQDAIDRKAAAAERAAGQAAPKAEKKG